MVRNEQFLPSRNKRRPTEDIDALDELIFVAEEYKELTVSVRFTRGGL